MQDEIDRSLLLQATGPEHLPLGRIMVNEGFLSEDQHSQVLAIQRKNLAAPDPVSKKDREGHLFGKLALREGLLSQEEVNDCLKAQAREGEKRTLGEIMISKGYLTPAQVKLLLGKQEKKLMSCPTCQLSFTVLTISREKNIDCPRCRKPLQDGKPTESTRSDAEFATAILRAAKEEVPPESLSASRIILPGSQKLRLKCPICEKQIQADLDSTGRVRCTLCHSTFVPL
jgi:hypothetical protein